MILAGGTINFDSLERDCNRRIPAPNIANLIHCRALDLPRDQVADFKDERVKAIAALNPVTGAIVGAEGLADIKIPVLMVGGTSDPATPVVIEQLRAFVWLGSRDKYLGILGGQAHVNFDQLDGSLEVATDLMFTIQRPNQNSFNRYGNFYYTAFARVYLSQDESFRPYLQSGFSQYISQPPNPVHVVHSGASPALANFFNQRKPANILPIISPENSYRTDSP